MISIAYLKTMARYNGWMNDRLYECCARMTDAQRKEDVGAFFKSVHGTLNHLLLADRIWLGRFRNRPFPARALNQEVYADFGTLRHERRMTDQDISDWIASLTEADLARNLHYTPISNPQPRVSPMWLALTHFFNHQTHHRGQLTTLLMQRGIDPGVTDLLAMPA